MNKTPFEKIFSVFQELRLTDTERTSMRTRVAHYAHTHQQTPSHFWMRRFGILALSAVIIISSGGILASASQSSLPGNFLYPIKRSSESIKKMTLSSTNQKATYELSLLEKRFNEANTLITEQKMTRESEQILTQAIAQHTDDLKNETTIIAKTNPAEALVYTTKLSSILKTSSSILLAISDQQSKPVTQELALNTHTPTKLVLAAYRTADIVNNDTKKLETIVLVDTDIATIKTAEKKYNEAHELLIKQGIVKTTTTEPEKISTDKLIEEKQVETNSILLSSQDQKPVSDELKQTTPDTNQSITDEPVISDVPTIISLSIDTTDSSKPLEKDVATESEKATTITDLATILETAYKEKLYGKVIIIADKITQYFVDAEKIKTSERLYNIKVPEKSVTKEQIIEQQKTSEMLELTQESSLEAKNNTN